MITIKKEGNLNIYQEYENLKIKVEFLTDKLEELRDENFRLHSIISSMKDEIQLEKNTICKLNELNAHMMKEINEGKLEQKTQEKQINSNFLRKLTTINLVLNNNPISKIGGTRLTLRKNTSTQLNIEENQDKTKENEIRKVTFEEDYKRNMNQFSASMSSHLGDRDPVEITEQLSKNNITSKENIITNENKIEDEEWKAQIKALFNRYECGFSDEKKFEETLNNNLEDMQIFYELNHLITYKIDNPRQRNDIKNSEKSLDNIEVMLKDWSSKIKDLQKNSVPFLMSLQAFYTEIEKNLKSFTNNQEIYFILYVFVELFKKVEKDIETIISNLKDVLVESLYNDIKSEINKITSKDIKKKYSLCLEDFEKTQIKLINIKKSQIHKSPANYQALNNTYLQKLKVYENSKSEYIKQLNHIHFKFNLALNDKMCYLFLSLASLFGNACERINYLEDFIKIYTENFTKKENINQYLEESFLSSLSDLENYVKTYNLYANFKLTEKDGFLFKKTHNSKDYKKQFYEISEGVIYTLKKEKSTRIIKKKEISPLNLIHLRENIEIEYPYSFEIVSSKKQKPITFLTDCQKSQVEWCSVIKNNIEIMLAKSKEFSTKLIAEENKSNLATPEYLKSIFENKEKMINRIFKNNICADCKNNEACWVSINLCVLLCLECSGIHRKLGPSISKIRSLKLDNLSQEIVQIFYECGTASINQIWEANSINYMHLKPNPDSKIDIKEKWIKRKYVEKEFTNNKNYGKSAIDSLCQAIKEKNIIKVLESIVVMNINLQEKINLDNKIMTFLHYACIYGNTLVLEILIQNGANLMIMNDEHMKPLDLAQLLQKDNIVNYLNMKMGSEISNNESEKNIFK